MSETELFSNKLSESLLGSAYSKLTETAEDRIKLLREQKQNLPSVLDNDTLSKLRNGEYEISLKEYTDMATYSNLMTVAYGNNSASSFQQSLNNYLGTTDDKLANAKSFIDKMKDNGMSNKSALKLYSALQSYSMISAFKNYNFVNAKV